MKNSVFILWFEGLNPEIFSTVPSLTRLATDGVDLRLAPLPLFERGVCYYQTLTGTGSGKFGRFDAVYPERYTARESPGIPEGAVGRLLPEILRSQKLAVTSLEISDKCAIDTLAGQTFDCTLVRFLDAGNAEPDTIEAIVQSCVELAPPAAHMLVLTDVWNQAPGKLVNINDFLTDVGLLEVGVSRNHEHIAWSETLAYGLGTGQVWINLRGRESQGVVSSGREYQEVRDALVSELRTNWRDPQTNQPVVERVLKREDAYTGEFLFKAPDLIVVYRPGYATSPRGAALDFDGLSVCEVDAGVNAKAPYARIIASGPCLVNGLTWTASLIDLMPSVMYLLGQPIPMHVDGHIISSMFTQSYRQRTPERFADDDDLLSDEEQDLIVDRLRDLGYLG
jgi:hypothetical protein